MWYLWSPLPSGSTSGNSRSKTTFPLNVVPVITASLWQHQREQQIKDYIVVPVITASLWQHQQERQSKDDISISCSTCDHRFPLAAPAGTANQRRHRHRQPSLRECSPQTNARTQPGFWTIKQLIHSLPGRWTNKILGKPSCKYDNFNKIGCNVRKKKPFMEKCGKLLVKQSKNFFHLLHTISILFSI
jgi:hypothetical protein